MLLTPKEEVLRGLMGRYASLSFDKTGLINQYKAGETLEIAGFVRGGGLICRRPGSDDVITVSPWHLQLLPQDEK